MKPKTQKRLEAIQRLERSVRDLRLRSRANCLSEEDLIAITQKRHAEARRLRTQFKL